MNSVPQKDDFVRLSESILPELIGWRRTLHRSPELSFQEEKTSQFIAEILRQLDIPARIQVGGFGIVAEIVGKSGPKIGLRADLDALPIQESVDSEYASQTPGVMHACGHDAHVAMLLGAAWILKKRAAEGKLAGTVRLIFQPAEEKMDERGKSGATHMLESDPALFSELAAIFALHVSPSVEAGKLSFVSGVINASSDNFEIVVRGTAAHGALPHQGVDAIVAASALVQAIQQIVSRKLNPFASGVVTVGTIHGGQSENVIADEVKMTGTLRALDRATRQTLRDELARVCEGAHAFGALAELAIIEGYPPGNNDADLTQAAERAIERHLGKAAIHPSFGASMGSEDFSFMTARIPGSLVRVGVKNPKWTELRNLHTPTFDIDERALAVGAAALAIFAADCFDRT